MSSAISSGSWTLTISTGRSTTSPSSKRHTAQRGAPPSQTIARRLASHSQSDVRGVFDWAGDFQTIHIRKLDENSDPSGYFTAPERIESDGRKAIRHLEATPRRAKTDDLASIADNLADVYGQLNLLHPFREGNGRSQKVFFSAVLSTDQKIGRSPILRRGG